MDTLGKILIQHFGISGELAIVRDFFERFHTPAILIASFFTPPFKLFVLLSGAFHLPLPSFLLAILIGRWARFFLLTPFFLKVQSTLRKKKETGSNLKPL